MEKREAGLALAIAGLGLGAVALGGLVLGVLAKKAKAAPPPAPPPPGLANLYGQVTDALTGKSIPGVTVTLDGLVLYTDVGGNYSFINVTPGTYTITFQKEGYQTSSSAITLSEGNNQLNVALTPLAAAVTIDRLEIQCDLVNGIINTRITLTNHTNKTFIDQTPTGPYGGLVVQMAADGFVYPGTDWAYSIGGIFLPRPSDRLGIGNLVPGTGIRSSSVLLALGDKEEIQAAGRGYAHVWCRAGDETTTPMTIFFEVHAYFEGPFASTWQTWELSSWRPPPPPEIVIPSL